MLVRPRGNQPVGCGEQKQGGLCSWRVAERGLPYVQSFATSWGVSEAAIQSELFPVLQDKVKQRTPLWHYLKANVKHGPLAPIAMVAGALGVSKQRVHQFINDGRLPVITVAGKKFVSAHDLEQFLLVARRSGQRTEFHAAESYSEFLKRWRAEEAA